MFGAVYDKKNMTKMVVQLLPKMYVYLQVLHFFSTQSMAVNTCAFVYQVPCILLLPIRVTHARRLDHVDWQVFPASRLSGRQSVLDGLSFFGLKERC